MVVDVNLKSIQSSQVILAVVAAASAYNAGRMETVFDTQRDGINHPYVVYDSKRDGPNARQATFNDAGHQTVCKLIVKIT